MELAIRSNRTRSAINKGTSNQIQEREINRSDEDDGFLGFLILILCIMSCCMVRLGPDWVPPRASVWPTNLLDHMCHVTSCGTAGPNGASLHASLRSADLSTAAWSAMRSTIPMKEMKLDISARNISERDRQEPRNQKNLGCGSRNTLSLLP